MENNKDSYFKIINMKEKVQYEFEIFVFDVSPNYLVSLSEEIVPQCAFLVTWYKIVQSHSLYKRFII